MKNELFERLFKVSMGIALLAVVSLVLIGHGGDPSRIHACVKSNGQIRIISPSGTCDGPETPLDWNIAGLSGPPGPDGPPGPTGPAGPSNAYSNSGPIIVLPANSGFVSATRLPLATVTVPTGRYIVNTTAGSQDLTPFTMAFNTALDCEIRQDGIIIDSSMQGSYSFPGAILQLTYPLSATVTAQTSTLTLACGTVGSGGTGTAGAHGRIQAIKVETLTIQPF